MYRYCCCLLFSLLGASISIFAQKQLLDPVVLIQSGPEQSEQIGAGMLTGKLGDDLYILTALHVVGEYPDQITIRFRNNQETSAEVVASDEAVDIAIIKCKAPAGFNIKASFKFANKEPEIRQDLLIIGHPGGNKWRENYSNQIDGLKHNADNRLLEVTTNSIAGGSSGGVILNEQNELLGILTDVGGVFAIGVKSSHLKTLLNDDWNIPTNFMTGISPISEEEKALYLEHLREADKLFEEGVAGYRKEGTATFSKTESILRRSLQSLQNAYKILPSEELKTKFEKRHKFWKIFTENRFENRGGPVPD